MGLRSVKIRGSEILRSRIPKSVDVGFRHPRIRESDISRVRIPKSYDVVFRGLKISGSVLFLNLGPRNLEIKAFEILTFRIPRCRKFGFRNLTI